ncbi:conserved Plasmodium protein, unknown function [Plasmodium vinckei vinckei]|uniref:Uncharacterized protein n=1 Tax=Plasmodium vinckei vinckei TaxID=54757 RepID=A0A449BUZ5_PLAVN|nr:conserved Plasmodium protein, unknown function [Plasmodium vinckei vinckei]VEV57306.1 conserved Plasmodium protein, unknown function [Plasmodium vinckei vinckei]
MRTIQFLGPYSKFSQVTKCFKAEQIKTVKQFGTKFPYLYGETTSHPNISNKVKEYKSDLDAHINIFNDRLILSDKLKSNKIFSTYTKSYINKESEHILILCLKKINEYEKNKENIKISVFIYELQNLSKSKISYNVLKNIKTIKNFLDHINNNIHTASPSLLLSTAISYKNIKLNKYTYFKNILKTICNHIKVYKNNKLTKLLKSEDNDHNNKDDYQYTIQLLNKKKKNHKINMLNLYTNHLNNSALSYILHSYSSLFNVSNSYLLYICKYILLNVGNLNYLDMLSLLYFMNKSNIKISKSDILHCINSNALTNPNKIEVATNNYNNKKRTHKNNAKLDSSTNSLTPNGQVVVQNVTQLNNSNIKYSEYKNTYIKILRTIIHLINKKTAINENTNVLILILYYYFKMNLVPIQIFYKLHYRIKKNIKNIDIKYISLYLYILSNIKFNLGFYKFIYKYLADVFTNRTKEFNTLSLCLSFYSLSKNEYYDDKHAESLNDVNITNIIYTLGKLKKKDENLFDILCEILTRRIENISAINLSLIIHSLSKVHYQNDKFYKICLDKGKELLCSFTPKQLIVFTIGLVMNNIYDFEFMQLFFNHIISIDSDNSGVNDGSKKINKKNNKKNNMLSIICFSTVLERENFIKQFPLSINTFISKNLNFVQSKEYTTMHDEILNILNYLNIDNFEIVKEKKPYMFDIFIKGDNKNIYIDILSKKKYLACSENLNGFMELKKRHMKLLNGKYYYFDKDSFISLDSIDKKTNFIKNFLQNICFYNFNALNQADEQTKRDITNLIYSSQNEKKKNINMNPEKEQNSSQKYNTTNLIKNRNYFLFPTYSKIENVEKNLHKKNKKKIDYGEPLIKKHQIFIDYDQGILLNQTKVNLMNNPFQNIHDKDNNTYLLHNENNFLFSKKCHGLTKFECVDKKSGKIIIKKNKLFW